MVMKARILCGICTRALAVAVFANISIGVAVAAPQQADTESVDDSSAAQQAPGGAPEIIVTGSRVVTNGFQAPTPVTVLSVDQLRNTSPNVVEALRSLPQLTGSTSPTTPQLVAEGGPTTTSSFNLRNLGVQRTLVLVNGKRPMISGGTGVSDATLIPLDLLKRVDVVTGGASAAYGSDAVSGVVNFIIDDKFSGMKLDVRQGISNYGDGPQTIVQGSAGANFAGDRGNIVFSGGYSRQGQIDGEARDWSRAHQAVISNPLSGTPGQPVSLLRSNVTIPYAAFGGLSFNAPGGPTVFDIAGNPRPFNGGSLNTGASAVGGDGAAYGATISAENETYNLFGRLGYEFADNWKVFGEAAYQRSQTSYDLVYPIIGVFQAPYTINQDNAFLPASLRAQMIANGQDSFSMSKIARAEGFNTTFSDIRTYSFAGGISGSLFGDWSADVYVQHGKSDVRYGTANNSISDRVYLSSDAVFDGAGNIVCRSTLTNPTNGCVPVNPFGEVPLNDAQRAYLKGDATAWVTTKQTVATVSAQGTLLHTWAGPVKTAVGAEYRKVSSFTTVDPISAAGNFQISFPSASGGSYDVKETFGEILIPLLADSAIAQSLDFNGAVRYTDYSTSGGVTTWKLGMTWALSDAVRFRGTVSRDIRAPNVNELFGGRSFVPATLLDPNFNNQAFFGIPVVGGSNPSLNPEQATTKTLGVVLQPGFLPGLGLSVDYYNLKIDGAIAQLAAQNILNQCAAGNASLCDLITRDASGALTNISAQLINVQTARVSGIDFDADYRFELGQGMVSLRGVATYLDKFTFETPGAAPLIQAGVAPRPKWQGSLSAAYAQGGFNIFVRERIIGSALRVQPPLTVDKPRVPVIGYTDLTISQKVGGLGGGSRAMGEIYMTVNNLFNQDPPATETNACLVGVCSPTSNTLYDLVGRYFTVGFRMTL